MEEYHNFQGEREPGYAAVPRTTTATLTPPGLMKGVGHANPHLH